MCEHAGRFEGRVDAIDFKVVATHLCMHSPGRLRQKPKFPIGLLFLSSSGWLVILGQWNVAVA